jgi:nitrile hydratase
MGGFQDTGPIHYEPDEPVFHDDWERRLYALTRVTRLGPKWNIHMSRYTMESLPPEQYLGVSYYQRWLLGFEKRLVASGVISAEELADGKPRPGGTPSPKMTADEIRAKTGPWRAPQPEHSDLAPRFKPGDSVVARNINPRGHTRLPRYARGRRGVVERDLGVQALPDSWVASMDPKPQHVYSVRFAAQELWGAEASPRDCVYLDMWDDYLDPA